MEDGLEGRISAGSDPLSALRSAAGDRLRQELGAEGLAKASPMQLAERANDVLEASGRGARGQAEPDRPAPAATRDRRHDAARARRGGPCPGRGAGRRRAAARPARRERGQGRARGQEQARAPGQGPGDADADAAHRHLGGLGARAGGAAHPDRRDRRRDHRRAEDQAQRARAALDAGAGRRDARPGPARGAAPTTPISDIMVNGPHQTFIERKGKLELAQIQFRDEEHLLQIARASSTRSAAASTRPRRSPTPASRTAAASTSSSRRCPSRHRHLDPQILRKADHPRHDARRAHLATRWRRCSRSPAGRG